MEENHKDEKAKLEREIEMYNFEINEVERKYGDLAKLAVLMTKRI
jgi:hypothetical protein